MYHLLLIDSTDELAFREFNDILNELVQRSQVPGNILKAALRTLIRIVDLGIGINPQILTLMCDCQFETQNRDQEEAVLLVIQKLITKMTQKNEIDDSIKKTCFAYLFKILKKKVKEDGCSLHFLEGTKRSINKLLKVAATPENIQWICAKIQIGLANLRTSQHTSSTEYEQCRDHTAFLIKSYTECLRGNRQIFHFSTTTDILCKTAECT